jgi:hypothetical protein
MTYNYKPTTTTQILALLSILLDIFVLSLVVKATWNSVVVDVLNIQALTYNQALILRFAYSALTSNWFCHGMNIYTYQKEFCAYANMVSTRFLQIVHEIKTRVPANNRGLEYNV